MHLPSPLTTAAPGAGGAQSLVGAYCSAAGVLLIVLALSFVVIQFVLANFVIVQSLAPGASPTASNITGTFSASAVRA
eukprot:tig00000523_g1845.t1